MVHIFSSTEVAERPSLDRLLGKSILDRFVHKAGVGENAGSASSDEPENRGYGRRKDAKGNSDNQEGSVELGSGSVNRAWGGERPLVLVFLLQITVLVQHLREQGFLL